MSTTSPIRKEEDLQRFRNYYLEKGKMRNYLLIVVGLNTALRIGDVLSLQWKDVYDYKRRRFRAHLQVVEQKTGKTNQIALNAAFCMHCGNATTAKKQTNIYFIVHVIKISRSAAAKLGELCGRQQRRQG